MVPNGTSLGVHQLAVYESCCGHACLNGCRDLFFIEEYIHPFEKIELFLPPSDKLSGTAEVMQICQIDCTVSFDKGFQMAESTEDQARE